MAAPGTAVPMVPGAVPTEVQGHPAGPRAGAAPSCRPGAIGCALRGPRGTSGGDAKEAEGYVTTQETANRL